MKVLVACEFSGIVREAFAKRGHDAWSCDLLPTEIPGQHYQDNIFNVLFADDGKYPLIETWDLMIAHPPCTRLSNSGVRWLKERNLWSEMENAAYLFRYLWGTRYQIGRVCIENPIPHKYALEIIGRKYDQIIQPWQFGHEETKATCLWIRGLPQLQPTNIVNNREQKIHKLSALRGPGSSKTRQQDRSRTYQGIADAMASQWSL
jgi:hypothetical protein